MSEGGFLEQRPRHPGSLVIVIALHAAAITALALSKMDVPEIIKSGPFKVRNIPIEPDPEPVPQPAQKQKELPKSVIDGVPPVVDIAPRPAFIVPEPPSPPMPYDPGPIGGLAVDPVPPPPLPDPAPPVRREAQIDSRSQLQPPYPASEERLGNEGSVTIRIAIGADGRVTAAEKVRATSDAFYVATERHALRNWRFKPATVDGRPIESRKVMTVHFRLRG